MLGCRRSGTVSRPPETEVATDPDNIPPRSRLFMVVPKTADGSVIEVCRRASATSMRVASSVYRAANGPAYASASRPIA